MTPFSKNYRNIVDLRKDLGIMTNSQRTSQRVYEPVWTSDSALVKAHQVFPNHYPSSSNGEFCWRLMERLVPETTLTLLKPDEFFVENGIKYLKVASGGNILAVLTTRAINRVKISPIDEFFKANIHVTARQAKMNTLDDDIKIAQSLLSQPSVSSKMSHKEIDDLKEKMEKNQRQYDLLKASAPEDRTVGFPGTGYF